MQIQKIENEPVWYQAYRPQTIADMCLPARIRNEISAFEDPSVAMPAMVFAGPAGCGKTTAHEAICRARGMTVYKINGSRECGIDMVRNEIMSFATRRGFEDSKASGGVGRIILLDEIDGLTPAAQEAMRGTIEELSHCCAFAGTCNHSQKLTPAIRSRMDVVDFTMTQDEVKKCSGQFFRRMELALQNEGVEYDKGVLAKLTQKMAPDFRSMFNLVQRYSAGSKKLDIGILARFDLQVSFDELQGFLKAGDIPKMRDWVKANSQFAMDGLYRMTYENLFDRVTEQTQGILIVQTEQFKFRHASVADPEISILAYLTFLSKTLAWK